MYARDRYFLPHAGSVLLFFILLLLVLTKGCICETEGVNRGDINLYPIEEEWKLGEELAQRLERELSLVEDPRALSYINALGTQIVDHTELAELPWHFHIVADPAVNAFAIPGGHIYVNTGLVTATDNLSELVGVLSHEIAHVTARHSTERMTKIFGLDRLARLILDENSGILEQIIAQIAGQGAIAKFSRDDEREADRLGITYLYEAGYDPEGMASFFRDLLQTQRRHPNAVERFFSTHPITDERIQATEELIAQLEPRDSNIEGGGEFDLFRSRMIQLNPEEQIQPPQ